jgi:cell division protein FtsL
MATRKVRHHSYAQDYSNARQMYVYGNAVPKPQYEQPYEVERPRKKRASKQVRENRSNALHMNRSYVIFLAVAAIAMLIVCVNYIQLRSTIISRSANITALQEELASLKEENNTKYSVVMDSVNLEDVRTTALEELGMVYADKDQIVEYNNPTGGYVKQYEVIPEDGVIASSKDVQN